MSARQVVFVRTTDNNYQRKKSANICLSENFSVVDDFCSVFEVDENVNKTQPFSKLSENVNKTQPFAKLSENLNKTQQFAKLSENVNKTQPFAKLSENLNKTQPFAKLSEKNEVLGIYYYIRQHY